jgi:hypothetical protein
MIKHYQSYFWRMGKPYGKGVLPPSAECSYKIVTDPYFKRFSVEKYKKGHFDQVIYDSLLLDFRRLNPLNQMAWQKEMLKEQQDISICLLRNEEDRAVLIEKHHFEGDRCRSCTLTSIHGIFLSTHRMYYKALNDSFDGVVLFDVENRPVMMKLYEIDPATGEFSTLLKEEWNMEHPPSYL